MFFVVFIEVHVYTKFYLELHAHLCHVWSEAVCCCFTGTTLFTNILVYLCTSVHGFLSIRKVSSLNSVQILKSNNNNEKMKKL